MSTALEVGLECFFYSIGYLTRYDLNSVLSGYRENQSARQLDLVISRWRRNQWIEQHGRGRGASYSITDLGRQRVPIQQPADHWNRQWDGQWRVFFFDLPAHRSRERRVLWRALREAKLGLLQWSTWIWPHEIEPLLRKVIAAKNIPECFCGFRASSLFLCDTQELVRAAWDFKKIEQAHQTYLQHNVATPPVLNREGTLQGLARVARIERQAYQYAWALDPLLPRCLWPGKYRGEQVEAKHQQFQSALKKRFAQLSHQP